MELLQSEPRLKKSSNQDWRENVKLSFGLLSEIRLSAGLNHFTGEEAKRSRAFEFRGSSRQQEVVKTEHSIRL